MNSSPIKKTSPLVLFQLTLFLILLPTILSRDDEPFDFACGPNEYQASGECKECHKKCETSICVGSGHSQCCLHGSYKKDEITCGECSGSCLTCEGTADNCLVSCQSPCKTCAGSSYSCASCLNDTDYYLEDSQCKTCHVKCLGCTGNLDSNCILCKGDNRNKDDQCSCNSGYFENSSGNCEKCSNTCLTCTGTSGNCIIPCQSPCLTCETTVSTCLSCISQDFYLESNQCLNCDPKCDQCTGPGSTNCIQCLGVNRNKDKNCECNTKYFENSSGVCEECSASCENCIDNRDNCISDLVCDSPCLTCRDLSTFCLSCVSELYYLQDNKCNLCHEKCDRCTGEGSNNCINCLGNFRDKTNNCECQEGYFENSLQQCEKCDSTCVTCENSAENCIIPCLFPCLNCQNQEEDNCIDCVEQAYQVVNQCFECHSKCDQCTGAGDGNCIRCQGENRDKTSNCDCLQGFYEDSSQICLECPLNCLTCTSEHNCLTCIGNFRELSNICECEMGYFENSYNQECEKCDSTCITCENSAENCIIPCQYPCLTCLNQDNNCVDCVEQAYKIGNQCFECHQKCDQCTGAGDGNCIRCQGQNRDKNTNCDYIQGYYEDSTQICSECPENCLSCNSEHICTSCIGIFRDASNKCDCQVGYFQNSSQQCEKCDSTCVTCENQAENCIIPCKYPCLNCQNQEEDNCIDCVEKAYQVGNQCFECDYKCDQCSGPGGENCTQCQGENRDQTSNCECIQGYYEDSNSICQKCSQNCLACTESKDNCTICQPGLFRNNDLPSCGCQIGYYSVPQTNDCQECQPQCKTCKNNQVCTSCHSEVLKPPFCLSEQSFFSTEIGDEVVHFQCPIKCNDCDSTGKCLTCSNGLHRLEIYKQCNCQTGYQDQNGTLKNCSPCSEGCLSCVNSQVCEQCDIKAHRELDSYSGRCECIEGYKQSQKNGDLACEKCYMYKHECYLVCPDSTVHDHDNYICLNISSTESEHVPIFITVSIFLIIIMVLVKQILTRSLKKFFIKKKLNALSLYEKNYEEEKPKNSQNNNYNDNNNNENNNENSNSNNSSPEKANSEIKITTLLDEINQNLTLNQSSSQYPLTIDLGESRKDIISENTDIQQQEQKKQQRRKQCTLIQSKSKSNLGDEQA